MNKHDAIYFPEFDANTQLMDACPNGPGSSYDAVNYTYNDNPRLNEDNTYCIIMTRMADLPEHYCLVLQSVSGHKVLFNDIVKWSRAQALIEQFENDYPVIDLQDLL